jgi:hypothetical protein
VRPCKSGDGGKKVVGSAGGCGCESWGQVMKEGAVEWGVVSGVTNANQGRCHAWLVLVASVILINHYRAVLTQVLIG